MTTRQDGFETHSEPNVNWDLCQASSSRWLEVCKYEVHGPNQICLAIVANHQCGKCSGNGHGFGCISILAEVFREIMTAMQIKFYFT